MIRECPHCHAANSILEWYCVECGLVFEASSEQIPSRSPIVFQANTRVRVMGVSDRKGQLGTVWIGMRPGDETVLVFFHNGTCRFTPQELVQAMDDGSPVTMEEQRTWATQWEAAE